jgi:hypothetical protein
MKRKTKEENRKIMRMSSMDHYKITKLDFSVNDSVSQPPLHIFVQVFVPYHELMIKEGNQNSG